MSEQSYGSSGNMPPPDGPLPWDPHSYGTTSYHRQMLAPAVRIKADVAIAVIRWVA